MKETSRRNFIKGGAAAAALAALACVGSSFAASADQGGTADILLADLDEMEPSRPEPRLSTESFSVTLNGNQSLQKQMVLSGSYRYWIMLVTNTGSHNIQVDVNGQIFTVSANTAGYIHSTSRWGAGTYTIGFTAAGAGNLMSGTAVCKICTTLAEATP